MRQLFTTNDLAIAKIILVDMEKLLEETPREGIIDKSSKFDDLRKSTIVEYGIS